MAKTRLLVVLSFLVPFVAWVAVSLFVGLYLPVDLLSIRLSHHAGRIALGQSWKGEDIPLSIRIHPVTASPLVIFWESMVRR
jgi:hypothetical protein